MRISDWSSDVCSSDLLVAAGKDAGIADARVQRHRQPGDGAPRPEGHDRADECGRTDDRLRHLRPAKTAAVIRDHRRGQRLRLARARVEVPSSRATMCNAGVNLGKADYVTHMLSSEEHPSELQSLMR